MAGGSVGTIFCELDLDSSRYLKSQQKLLQDATTTSLSIEDNFRKLGVKSSAEFDLMRAKITNSFDMIKNSAKATANDIARAEEAKNARLKALNEQQFGHQTTMIEGLKKNWIAASAAVAAAWYAVNKVAGSLSEVVMAAARYETLGIVMRVVGNNAGYSGAQMEAFAKSLEKSGISMSGARESLTRMSQAQLDLNKSTQLARIAQDAAVIGNLNSTDAFQRLVYGIQSAQVEMLRTIGINVNFENSYQKVAKETGRVSTSFSEAEKATIRMNAVIEAGVGIAGTYEAAMKTAGKQLASLERHFENVKVAAGLAFTPALAETVESITGAVSGLSGELSGNSKDAIISWGTNFRIGIIGVEAEIRRIAMLLDKLGGTMTSAQMLLYGPGAAMGFESSKKRFESAAQANIEYEERYKKSDKELEKLALKQIELEYSLTDAGKAASKATLDALEKKRIAAAASNIEAEKVIEVDKKAAAAAKKAADEEAKLQAFKVDLYIKDEARKWEELEKYEKEYAEEQKRIDDETTKLALKDFDDYLAREKEKAETIKKNASDRLAAERDIYEDLRGYEGSYYESSKKMIDEQAEAYRKLGVDQVAVIQWVTKEYERAEIKKLKASGKFFDGVKAYLKELKDEQTTWGEAGYEMIKSFADNAKSTLSTVLFDGAKGQMKSFEDYFQSFTDTILKKFTDMVAQMIVEWLMLEGMESFKSLVGGLGGMLSSATVFHMGGIVGQSGTPTRMIPAAAFAGAPRLHNGLAADEFPAILQRGERVLSKREVAQGGGNNISISMPISITGGGGKKWADSLRGEIRDLVDRRVKDLM